MANAMNVLNEEEKKYFDSRGDYEPAGYSAGDQEFGEDSEAEQDSGSEAGFEESSQGFDAALSSGNGAEETERYDKGSAEDNEHQSEPRNKASQRDFTKAYGIAESKRQELKAQLEEQNRHNQMLQQQLQMLMQNQQRPPMQQQQAQQVEIPDPNEDPLGYQSYQLNQLNRTVQQQQYYLAQQAKAQQEMQAINQLDNAYKASAIEFSKQAPDFMDAYKFLERSKIQEYVALGYSPIEASQMLQREEREFAIKSFKERTNPAARVYAAAKARGFNPDGETKLEKVSKGMEKGKSLPRAGGKNIEKGYDISRLDDMSDAEFDKFFNQVKAESKKNGDYKKDFY